MKINSELVYFHLCSGIPGSARIFMFVLPSPGILIGDPHITTLDGRTYIFNGLGEYRLLEVDATVGTSSGSSATSRSVDFKMQVRHR